jgi:hypothetical protein
MKKPYQLASLFYPDTPKESSQGLGKLTARKDWHLLNILVTT